jgi:hypothetical protein
MASIPFPLSSSPGRTPQEGNGRLINAYAEPLGQDTHVGGSSPPESITWRRSPGLTAFATAAVGTGCRGFLLVNGNLFFAVANKLYYTTSGGGAATLVGTLSGTLPVYFSRNNAALPDLVVITENGAFSFTTAGITAFADVDLPAPNGVTFLDSYLIFSIGDGRLFATGQNAVTVNSLDNTKAEAKPDGLSRPVAFGSQLFAFGPLSTEVYVDTANPTGFPFTRSFVITRGLLSASAVAGHEDGFGSALIWVADDCTVVQNNHTVSPLKISPPDLDRAIQAVADKTKLKAFVYIADGHPKWVLTSDTWTWEFDLNTQKWDERSSYPSGRWQAEFSVSAFGKWLVGQATGSAILAIDSLNYAEADQPLLFRLESGPVSKFPQRTRVGAAYFNFSTGAGLISGDIPSTDPSVSISWSDDGGVSWSNPVIRKLGKIGVPTTTVEINRSGMTGRQGRRWRIDVSDPVYVGFLSAAQELTPLNP